MGLIQNRLDTVFGAAIYASNLNIFTVKNSNFSDFNHGSVGGVIYISVSSTTRGAIPLNPIYSLESCSFKNNSAYKGGAIYIDYVEYALISSCSFIGNSASSSNSGEGYGGAIYYSSSGNIIKFQL